MRLATPALLLSVLLVAAPLPNVVGAQAAEPRDFILPADEGYGIGACLQPGSACGESLATAWCQAHGHIKVLSFGAVDLGETASGLVAAAAEPAAVSIQCGD